MIEPERTQVLDMIESGQISADDGVQLLEAVEPVTAISDLTGRWLRIQINDLHTHRFIANVNLPLSWVALGLQIGSRFQPELSTVNLMDVVRTVTEDTQGRILDVEDEAEGRRIQIFVD